MEFLVSEAVSPAGTFVIVALEVPKKFSPFTPVNVSFAIVMTREFAMAPMFATDSVNVVEP